MKKEFRKLMTAAVCFCLLTAGCGSMPETVENQPEQTASVTTTASETESIETTLITTSATETETTVTEIVTTVTVSETQESETETTVPVTETETVKEISEDEVRALTNPLTKEAAAPFQVKVSNVWKVYWINVERSDLKGLKPDDFRFFNDYINEHFEPDACDFYVVVTDIPDLCFQFTVTKSEYLRSTCKHLPELQRLMQASIILTAEPAHVRSDSVTRISLNFKLYAKMNTDWSSTMMIRSIIFQNLVMICSQSLMNYSKTHAKYHQIPRNTHQIPRNTHQIPRNTHQI